MKKTRMATLFLAVLMAFSLMATPAFAASGSYAAAGPTYGGNPYAPVILGPGTVVVEEHAEADLIHVFLEDQVVVTMDEKFVLDYTSTATYADRGFSSRGGYAWVAEEAVNRILREKMVARAADGKSCTYGDKVIHLSTATGDSLALDYLITNFFRQPVKEIRNLDTVSYTLVYRNGRTATSYISVRSYGDKTPNASTTYCDIWQVRDLDDETIEVYLRNGMIVTLKKQMIVDWVDARQQLGNTFGISSWHDRWEMNDEGATACEDFCQTLLDNLIRQGWTVFPAEALEPNYSYRKFPVEDVMWQGVTSSRVLVRSLERLRTEDTASDITIYFDYSNWYGRWTHSVAHEMRFEFLCRDNNTVSGFNFYDLSRPEYFMRGFNAAQGVWLTDAEVRDISW